ncbi:MAG: cob(I)yrinic acid a,c-diamide adenosyltransferase [Polyangiales bacterium]
MKIYTKTGDAGETGLFGGTRVSKASLRVEAYGEVDELNSALGWARLAVSDEALDAVLNRIQNDLFEVGAELGSTEASKQKSVVPLIAEPQVEALERAIDQYEEGPPALTSFVLPGGSEGASRFHLARCVCRRAERSVVALGAQDSLRGEVLRYLNRLSDLLFVLARYANHAAGVEDIPWKGQRG